MKVGHFVTIAISTAPLQLSGPTTSRNRADRSGTSGLLPLLIGRIKRPNRRKLRME